MKQSVIILLIILFTGCSSYRISSDIENPYKGIPFYTFSAHLKQVTQYTRKWIVISLEFKTVDGNNNPYYNLSTHYFMNPKEYDQLKLIDAFNEANKVISKGYKVINEAFYGKLKLVKGILDIDIINRETGTGLTVPSHLSQTLISNTVSVEKFIDYSKKYFYNTSQYVFTQPPASDIELNENGMISIKNRPQDDRASVDLVLSGKSFIPGKEVLLKQQGEISDNYQLLMLVYVDGYIYELIKFRDFSNDLDFPPLDFESTQTIKMSRFINENKEIHRDSNCESYSNIKQEHVL